MVGRRVGGEQAKRLRQLEKKTALRVAKEEDAKKQHQEGSFERNPNLLQNRKGTSRSCGWENPHEEKEANRSRKGKRKICRLPSLKKGEVLHLPGRKREKKEDALPATWPTIKKRSFTSLPGGGEVFKRGGLVPSEKSPSWEKKKARCV